MALERWRPFGSVDRWDPFRNLGDIQGEVNRLFDAFSGRSMPTTGVQGRSWMPPVDMHDPGVIREIISRTRSAADDPLLASSPSVSPST